jgi:hypothetical protein
MPGRIRWKSIFGHELGFGEQGELATRVGGALRRLTSPAVHVTGTIGAESANARAISLQVRERHGDPINYIADIEVQVTLDAAGTDFAATGGSTGIAIGASGKLLAVVAKKLFRCKTNAAGVLSLTYTDTGTEACHLHVCLPNGEVVYIGNMTNA